jgi:hypothetical protein
MPAASSIAVRRYIIWAARKAIGRRISSFATRGFESPRVAFSADNDLLLGTIAVCGLWAAMAFVFVAVAFATAVKAPELPAGAVPLPQPTVGGPQMWVSGVAGFLVVLVAFLCLPAIVIIPSLLLFLRRRFASMGQLRTNLASIATLLKLMSQTSQAPSIDLPSELSKNGLPGRR